ncbi:MAG TPA: hypothetical protein VK841_07125, partial [Polyangiaceae bacterium]|nr:hypothetical protein [Polyangiaceae bacterium]
SGICAIYPPDGTRATANGAVASDACCAVPRHGFDSICAQEDADGGVIAPPADVPETALVATCDSSSASATSPGGSNDGSRRAGGCATSAFAPRRGTRDAATMSALILGLLAIARLRAGRAAWRKRHKKDACCTVLNESI